MTTYFISDIHLNANSKAQSTMLLEFLRNKAVNADAVYILGDLFAIWLGDDLNEPYSEELSQTLRELAAKDVPLYFMRGNRDFMVGKQFCERSSCTLLEDPSTINLYGQQVLLTHGDQLCTLDLNYQKFRKLVQHPIVRPIFLSLPLILRKKLAAWVKSQARDKVQQAPAAYDVEEKTVDLWFNTHGVNKMIHGHTHKPAIHNHANNNTRIVLGDWNPTMAQILAVTRQGYELIDLATSPNMDPVQTVHHNDSLSPIISL